MGWLEPRSRELPDHETLYDPAHRGISASVNFLTCHDGFTLYDLYSYNMKHNEKNGWGNTDGDNNGNSWNCGAEGATDDPNRGLAPPHGKKCIRNIDAPRTY